MNPPIFSIITPSYNSGHTIEKTIESILHQTFSDFEYIIIDGGSKDNTLEIIKKYEPMFMGRLRWVSEKDNGIYNAMNKGLLKVKGNIVGIVNSDDWLEISTLDHIKQVIFKYNLDLNSPFAIAGGMNFHFKDGNYITINCSSEKFQHYSKVYRMGLNHPSTFVSMQVYKQLGLFDENLRLYADADLAVRLYKNGIPVIFTDTVLSNMRDGGISNKYSKAIMKDNKYILKKHCASQIEYYKLLTYRWILTNLKYLGYPLLKQYRKTANKIRIN